MIAELNYTAYFESAVAAGRKTKLDATQINLVLTDLADAAVAATEKLLQANRLDLDRMNPANPNYDRLKLTTARIQDIAKDIRNVARLESPLGHILMEKAMPNGLQISKVTVPLGVIGIIYEARPNVTFDVFALCFKSGNVCVLKGGSDASYSNQWVSLRAPSRPSAYDHLGF